MRISKKDRKKIAELINSCVIWGTAVINAVAQNEHEKVPQFMKWHNDSGRELNAMLEVNAITIFKHCDTEEEY
ncbi:hypothetical protein M0R04_04825 [Candidatus Dojkabacteria bacterium]|jgi:hypothetical protein|nr:hypothetical protein [Candidatus Dojkabacteria bacterium]